MLEYLSIAIFKRSAARFIRSTVTSAPIFSTMSFVSFRSNARGVPKNVIVQRGVNAHTKDVMAPPKKTIPIADAVRATIFARIATIILGPGRSDFKIWTNVGVTSGAISVCFRVGIKNPSSACPVNPVPYWLTYCWTASCGTKLEYSVGSYAWLLRSWKN